MMGSLGRRESADPDQGWQIRPARPDDYENLIVLWTQAGLSFRPTGRDSRDRFNRELTCFPSTYLLAEADKGLVGSVLGTHDQRKGWINRLAVLPAYRRRGMASALIRACEAAFHAQGIEIVAALIEPQNSGSRALFDRLGFATDVPVCYYRRLRRPDF